VIDLYTWSTPNGKKIAIMLEETGLEYRFIPVDLQAKQQFSDQFISISPNHKIPAIVDHHPQDSEQPVTLFESGAILHYLAEKTGQFMGAPGNQHDVMSWLFFQTSYLGPNLGNLHQFMSDTENQCDAAIQRFLAESHRALGVIEARLNAVSYLGGAEYSVADMAAFPWVVVALPVLETLDQAGSTGSCRQTQQWLENIQNRSAVVRGMRFPPEQ
jgi:GST-like protein